MNCPCCNTEALKITSYGCDGFELDHAEEEGIDGGLNYYFHAQCHECKKDLTLWFKLVSVEEEKE